jgi:hypothetical protein
LTPEEEIAFLRAHIHEQDYKFRMLQESARSRAEEMRERAAKVAEGLYACTCDKSYDVVYRRGFAPPECFHCLPLAQAAQAIRALPLDSPKE